jgi:hypothetical protein
MPRPLKTLSVIVISFQTAHCFQQEPLAPPYLRPSSPRTPPTTLFQQQEDAETSRHEETGAASKGIVSSLTSFVNRFFPAEQKKDRAVLRGPPPASSRELLERIRDDYVARNYLWTGDVDLDCFDEQCRFQDPTISFTGTDTFVKNLQNLRPIVDALTTGGGGRDRPHCRSVLLEIQLESEYIRTRWNMVGDLEALPWKPRLDVIGRTKFWYNDENRVTFYDEEWEMPAGRALLQLVTPAGTISNQ